MDLLAPMMQAVSEIDLQNILSVSQSSVLFSGYSQIVRSFATGILVLYLTYAAINGIIWHISNFCVTGKNNFWKYQLQFFVLSFIFLFSAYVIFRIIHKSLINLDFLYPMKIITVIIILATWYFMMISFALINKYKLKQLKKHLKQTFITGYRKAKILIPTHLIILAVIFFTFYLIYISQDSIYLSALFLAIFLFLCALVWSRLYFLMTMKNIQE
jgi:hypothetical protein